MMKNAHGKGPNLGFGLAVAILIAIAMVSYRGTTELIQADASVAHTHEVIENLQSLLDDLMTIQTARRGYVLSGDERYLKAYADPANRVAPQIDSLRKLTSDNPRQQQRLDRLDPLMKSRFSILNQSVELRRTQGLDVPTQVRLMDQGNKLQDEIRGVIVEMQQEERDLLDQRAGKSRATAKFTISIIFFGYLLGLGLLSLAFLALHREIGERTRAEQVILRTQDLLDSIIENIPDMIFLKDARDLRFVRINKAGERLLGVSREELIGKNDRHFFPKEEADFFTAKDREVLNEGKLLDVPEEPIQTRNRGIRILHTKKMPLLGKEGAPQFLLGISEDITERKKAEFALRESEERFRMLVDGVQDYAILRLDPNGLVASWNVGAERIKGYKAEEIIGQHFSRFYPPEDVASGKPQHELKIAAAEGRYEEEGARMRKDGTKFWANVVMTALRDQAGTLVGFSKVTRDITERKATEEAIRKLNRDLQGHAAQLETANKELEAFSYSVSHDLRAPLRSIDGFSQALLEDYRNKLDDQGRDYLQRVRAASQRMAQLIDDLLSLSRVTRNEMRHEEFDLSATARTVGEELGKAHPQRAVEFIVADGMNVQGDPQLLRILLDHLIGNAWKFTSAQPQAKIEVGALQCNGEGRYFVRDNGAGFDMTYVHKLFSPFQRLHGQKDFPGTGIGLATAQRIARRHGGRVWAESSVGQGATFYFTLGKES